MAPRIGVVTFPGTLDDQDAVRAVRIAGAEPVSLWHADADLHGVDAVILPGGFSYGDTLGAGEGWARSVLFDDRLTDQFAEFFARPGTFGLGICNGCQMFAALADLIPGAQAWPRFTRNSSEQYEARLSLVEVLDSPSVLGSPDARILSELADLVVLVAGYGKVTPESLEKGIGSFPADKVAGVVFNEIP